MKKRKASKRRTGARRATEWVGGRVLAPVFIQGDEPYRPVLEMWVADGGRR